MPDEIGDIIGALMSAGDDYSGADDIGALMNLSSGDEAGDIIGALMSAASGDDYSGADDVAKLLAVSGALGKGRRPQHGRGFNVKAFAQAFAKAQLMAKIKGAGALSYKPTSYNTARDVPIGFDSVTAVPAGATATLVQRPQEPFRPSRLFIPSDIAGAILVADIKVGNKSQLASNGALPGRMFQENATGVELGLDTCDPAIDLVLSVINISGAPIRVTAAFKGPAVQR